MAEHVGDLLSLQVHDNTKVAYLVPNLQRRKWRLRGDR